MVSAAATILQSVPSRGFWAGHLLAVVPILGIDDALDLWTGDGTGSGRLSSATPAPGHKRRHWHAGERSAASRLQRANFGSPGRRGTLGNYRTA